MIFIRLLLFCLLTVYSLPLISGAWHTDRQADASTANRVIVAEIKGRIDPGMYNYVQRTLSSAKDKGAPPLFFIMSTPGGYINTALDIRDLMDEYPGKINVYIRHQAISAGAYLALAADAIYMSPGSTMGAAEPRGLTGESVDEKTLSFWEGEMRVLAERRQREPQIAVAMVRKEIEIEGLVEKGKLLTLTSDEALEHGYCEGTPESFGILLDSLGLAEYETTELTPSLFDAIIGWTTNPFVATILLAVGIGGIVLELFTLGFGIAGVVGLLSFALYYSSHILGGLAGFEVIVFFLIGIALLIVEAFVPGLGIFGIGGAVAVFASIVMAASTVQSGLAMLLGSVLISALISFFTLRSLGRRGVLRKIILEDSATEERGYISSPSLKDLEGSVGLALTPLRPSGTVDFAGRRVDAVSEGQFIKQNTKVKVVKIEGIRVVVRELKEESPE